MRGIDVYCGGKDFVIKCENCLDKTGRAGCCLCMADLRFDAAKCYVLLFRIVFAKHSFQCFKFRIVSSNSSCSVRLNQADSFWRDTCYLISLIQGFGLALGPGRINAFEFAVT